MATKAELRQEIADLRAELDRALLELDRWREWWGVHISPPAQWYTSPPNWWDQQTWCGR